MVLPFLFHDVFPKYTNLLSPAKRLAPKVAIWESWNNLGKLVDIEVGTSYNPPVKRKLKIDSESADTE